MSRQNPSDSCSDRTVLSLFTGAGGLDLGLEAAGFSISICVEVAEDARGTLKANRPHWRHAEPGDIHKIPPHEILAQAGLTRGEATLLSGGPPCQPFSKSAYWTGNSHGLNDPRASGMLTFLKVIDVGLPKVLLLENVRGLASNEDGAGGLQLFENGLRSINRKRGSAYQLQVFHLNAASYGVPQSRERIFFLAAIDGRTLNVPPVTHGEGDHLEPYLTAWDAIGDLDRVDCPPELVPVGKWAELLKSIPEGRNYLWHTRRGGGEPLFGWRTRYWSFLLKLAKHRPSWTIQAEPGPATGPFHWRNRLLSVQELARLQTFPDGYQFVGNRQSVQRQIGNAVPCALGELLGREIRRQFLGERDIGRQLNLIPRRQADCPQEHPLDPVPESYLNLRGDHADHPGKGRGPGKVWKGKANMDRGDQT
ncbi:MAG: DNA cytosine methyltransferase [Syntrophobacteraceae bacterium]